MKTPEDVREVMRIDTAQLDHELIAQPEYVYDVNMAHALAISRRDAFKEKLSLMEVAAKRELRETLETELGKKPTAGDVSDALLEDVDLQEARQKLLELDDLIRRWAVCTESMKRRGYALHELCKQHDTLGAAIAGQSERRRDADREVENARKNRRRRRRDVA